MHKNKDRIEELKEKRKKLKKEANKDVNTTFDRIDRDVAEIKLESVNEELKARQDEIERFEKMIDGILSGYWIGARIKSEEEKHNGRVKDWARIAQNKIVSTIKKELKQKLKEEEEE